MTTKRWLASAVLAWVSLVGASAHAAVTAAMSPIAVGPTEVATTGNGSTTLSSDQGGGENVASFVMGSGCTSEFTVTTGVPLHVPKSPSTAAVAVTFKPTAREATETCFVTMKDAGGTTLGMFSITGSGVGSELTNNTPPPVSFGSVRLTGGTSMETITLANTGDAGFDLHVSNLTITGAAATDYTIDSPTTFPQTITPGGTLDVNITFDPKAAGTRTATLNVFSDADLDPNPTIALTGTGTSAVIGVTDVAFGTVPPTTTGSGTISVTNTATTNIGPLTVSSAVIAGGTWFAFTANNGCTAGATSCTFTAQTAPLSVPVTCQPPTGATGSQSATVTFTSDTDPGGDATATLTCAAGGYTTSPAPGTGLAFGNIRYDQNATLTASIINTAGDPTTTVTITSMAVDISGGTALTGEFTVTGCKHGGTTVPCPTSTGTNPFKLVGMNDTLVVSIKCAPADRVAALTANLDLTSDLNTANPSLQLPLSAASITATLAIAPSMLIDFGPIDVHDTTAQMQTIMVQNMGLAPLTLGATTPSCTPSPCPFTFGPTGAQTVMPGASFSVDVTYLPTVERPAGQFDTASITWPFSGVCGADDMMCGGPSNVTVNIQGRGIDRHILAGTPPTFPDTFRNPGTAAPVLPETIMNTGEAPLDISAEMLSNSPVWMLQDPGAVQVAGGGSYNFQVQFAPTAAGKAPDGVLVIDNDDTGMPMVMITLQGNGLNRSVAMGPNVIDLGYTGIGIPVHLSAVAPNDLLAVTSMDGANTFSIREIDLSGTDAAMFAVQTTSGAAAQDVSLAPNATQSFDVAFTPTAVGDFTATATLYLDMDPTAQATVTLRGHGVFAEAHGGGGCQTGHASGLAMLGVVLAFAVGFGRRRRGALVAALAFVGLAGTARANDERDLDLTVFDPTPATTGTGFAVQNATVGDNGQWVLTGVVSYASNPLVIDTTSNTDTPVQQRTMLELGGAYAFLGRFEAGARMPLYIQNGQTVDNSMMFGVPPVTGSARGDLTLHVKVLGWRGALAGGDFAVGAGLSLTLPTASSNEFAGVSGPEGRGLALVSYSPGALDHRIAITLNAGGVVRGKTRYANIEQGSGVAWGAAGSYRVLDRLWAAAEMFGDVIPGGELDAPPAGGAMGPAHALSTVEALGGLRYQIERRVNIGLAAGRGVTTGIGSPDLRAVLLLTVSPSAPALAPLPGHDNSERDSDGDGIPDSRDKCPNDPEDKDGFQDADGCPDLDNDHDGVPDAKDKCPNVPEDRDGFQDADGCPDLDNDGDGIPDKDDKCPNEPEDKDGFQDHDGCPDLDNDGDGIPDKNDKCPNEPETINGVQDDDGCPDKGDSLVVLSPDRLELLEAIQFSGTKLGKASFNALGQVAATLRAHKEIVRIRLGSHVQPTRNAETDLELSQKRADAVRDWLVQWGIAPARLEARGFGGTKPLVPPSQRGAAQINDRLELVILERK
ncbi:MAG TPA: choice-of-anchor D domain-containing protein [Kofleriaceae bacterium]